KKPEPKKSEADHDLALALERQEEERQRYLAQQEERDLELARKLDLELNLDGDYVTWECILPMIEGVTEEMGVRWRTVNLLLVGGSDEPCEAAAFTISVGVKVGGATEEDAARAAAKRTYTTELSHLITGDEQSHCVGIRGNKWQSRDDVRCTWSLETVTVAIVGDGSVLSLYTRPMNRNKTRRVQRHVPPISRTSATLLQHFRNLGLAPPFPAPTLLNSSVPSATSWVSVTRAAGHKRQMNDHAEYSLSSITLEPRPEDAKHFRSVATQTEIPPPSAPSVPTRPPPPPLPRQIASSRIPPLKGDRKVWPDASHKMLSDNLFWGCLSRRLTATLEEMGVRWKSMEIVLVSGSEEPREAAVITVSVGVKVGALAEEDARRAIFPCFCILDQFDVTDVDIEFKEQEYYGVLAFD
ncbi:hypothetical protein EIP91_007937, partial [Steccherinum ochraceum]